MRSTSTLGGGSADEVVGLVLGWEALVDKLVLVVHEVTVGLEVVLLAVEELVQLHEPARVSVLTIWLRANVNVAVILDIFD